MQHIRRSGFSLRNQSLFVLRSCLKRSGPFKPVFDSGVADFSSVAAETSMVGDFSKKVARHVGGNSILVRNQSPFQLATSARRNITSPLSVRSFASNSTETNKGSQARKEISTVEDPFDAPTYNIPEKPVTFTEGASYSLIILAGLGIAGFAAYGVLNELVFQPKEYTIFNKALDRIKNDSQVRVRIGSPIKGYGSESKNRAARQRIPNKTWTDEEGVEHIMVNFIIRGPHGAGKVFTEMFKDKVDNQWKFMYLIVEVTSPSPAQLMLESYVPA